MKKIKFLSIATMVAFMTLGLSSCEKENFTVESPEIDVEIPEINIGGVEIPEGYKPGDALVSIQPSVIAFINGQVATVTDETTFTFDGKSALEYTTNEDGSINAFEVPVVASYKATIEGFTKTLTAETTVKIPNLAAGQVAIMYPTLMVSANGEVNISIEIAEESVVENKTVDFKNESDYCLETAQGKVKFELGYTLDEESTVITNGYEDNEEVKNILDSYNTKWEEVRDLTLHHIYANTLTRVPYSITVATINGQITESIDWARSADTERVAATFKATYRHSVIFDLENVESNLNLNGVGHGHGHSHGHGHGDDNNAGGGIIWGE